MPLLGDFTPEQAEVLKTATLKNGAVPNAFRAMGQNLKLAKVMRNLGGYFSVSKLLPERTMRLIILRTAHRTGSIYEFAQHRQMALTDGLLTLAEIDALVSENGQWSQQDRVYIDAVDETITQFRISDRTWEALVAMHPLETVEEVLLLIGTYLSLATFLNSAAVPLDDFVVDREWPARRQAAEPEASLVIQQPESEGKAK